MKTILLIDDEEMILSIFCLVLEHKGYRVFKAESGAEGLELARQNHPDLIVTDLSMPGMDGQAVLNQIRQDPALASTPVIVMTGDENMALSAEIKADALLVKPVDMTTLLQCIREKLG